MSALFYVVLSKALSKEPAIMKLSVASQIISKEHEFLHVERLGCLPQSDIDRNMTKIDQNHPVKPKCSGSPCGASPTKTCPAPEVTGFCAFCSAASGPAV